MASSKFIIMTVFSNEHGFVAKLQQKSSSTVVVEGLGTQVSNKQLTYYYPMKTLALPIDQLVGKEISFDPTLFDVVEKELELPSGDIAVTKWCYAAR
jgi:hypothetical protein